MTPNWVIFLVGAFVTGVWGSVIGALLYAASKPITRSDAGQELEPESKLRLSNAVNE